MATRGALGGLAVTTSDVVRVLDATGFDIIFVETVGIGQESAPFGRDMDQTIFVMGPDYGSRLQLQKIVMLDVADVVVVNKSDLAGAKTAISEVTSRVSNAHRRVIATTASRHGDAGVDEVFRAVVHRETSS